LSFTITLNGENIGTVTGWRNKKGANIVPIETPGADSDETEMVDMLGTIKFLEVSGVITGTFDSIQEKIFDIEALIDGDQETTYELVSNFVVNNTDYGTSAATKTLHVKVVDFDGDWEAPGFNRYNYRLKVITGKQEV